AACAALGAGIYRAGETQEQGGQAGGMSICEDMPSSDIRLILGCHVVPGMYLLQGGTVGGGVMKWMKKTLGCHSFAVMDEEAGSSAPGAGGVLLLPYFSGERSPIWDSRSCAVYYGMSYGTERKDLLRAGLESSAYTLRHNLETAYEAGASVSELSATGGASRSFLWTQIKADVTGKRIIVPDAENATVWGAAMLAGVGCGLFSSFEEAVEGSRKVLRVHEPDASLKNAYDSAYQRFLGLYGSLREYMHA
ncbi:MAG: carbohydrate kinase, partial [Clostridia bacterium]|nr:carbohydrate kinase [Clostridia bacterium]